MFLNGYLVTSDTEIRLNKIIKRFKELGEEYYNYRKFKSVKIISIENKKYVYVETKENLENEMTLLGFGFEGLIETEDKWNEIEQFGKYRCIIKRVDESIINAEILDSLY